MPPGLATQLSNATSGKNVENVEIVIIQKGKGVAPSDAPGAAAADSTQQQQMTEAPGAAATGHQEDFEQDSDPQQQQDLVPEEAFTPDQEHSEPDKQQQQREPRTRSSATATKPAAEGEQEQPQRRQRTAARLSAKAVAKAADEARTAAAAAVERGSKHTPKKLGPKVLEAIKELKKEMNEGGLSPATLEMVLASKPGVLEATTDPKSASMQQLREGLNGRACRTSSKGS